MTDTQYIHEAGPAHAARDAAPAARLLERLLPAPRECEVRVGGHTVLGADPGMAVRFTLIFASVAALRRAFTPPLERAMATAWLSGALDVEGDLVAAYAAIMGTSRRLSRSARDVAGLVRAWRALPTRDGADERPRVGGDGPGDAAPPVNAPTAGAGTAPADLAPALDGRAHSASRDREAVRHHYDLGNEFYGLFLDNRMVYSCGYFPTGEETLDRAQELKLELVCRKLRLRAGHRLLDIGCGWGALLIHAATHHGVHGVGITLSERQHALASARVREAGLDGRVEIRLADYRDLDPARERFDRVASVGMFEHVGEARLPEYFERVHALLRPGGLFLNHGVSRRADTRPRSALREWLTEPLTRLVVGRAGLTRAVFPDSELIPVSDANAIAERAGWEVRDVESLREHYARTLRHWVQRLEARSEEGASLVGAPTVRLWRIYFAGSAHRFDTGVLNIHQSLLARPSDDGRVQVPATRADLYG